MVKTMKKEETKKIKKQAKAKKQLIKESKSYSQNDDQFDVKRLITISLIVLAAVGIVYFVTAKFVINKSDSSKNSTEAEINYDVVSVGTILNRSYDEYYVLVFDSDSNKATYYSNMALAYSTSTNAIKIYTCDLSNGLNSKYKSDSETGNAEAKSISEFSFGEITLLYIKDGKVTKYIEGTEKINKELNK